MATYIRGHEFVIPRPLHALTDGALQAVESMRLAGLARTLEREVALIVTKHGAPAASQWVGDPVSRNARALLATALEAGWTAQLLVENDACTVEGYRLAPTKVGFRASWLRGSAHAFAWCSPWRYELIQDDRPIGKDAKALTGKVGYRSPGMGTTRLSLTGSPWGVKITWNEMQARVRSAGVMVDS